MDTKFASFLLQCVLTLHLVRQSSRLLQLGGDILGKEVEATSSLAQPALWALQVAQHLDWPMTNTNINDSNLVRCEVGEVESLPHLASHCQLRAFTQLLGR